MSDRNVVTLTLAGCALAFLVGVLTAGWGVYGPTQDLTERFCAEDMACWDCSTMGNGVCGQTGGR